MKLKSEIQHEYQLLYDDQLNIDLFYHVGICENPKRYTRSVLRCMKFKFESLREFFHIDTLDHGTKGVCNVYSCYCRSSMSHKSHSNKRKRSSQNQIQVQVHHRPLRVPGKNYAHFKSDHFP